MSPILISACLPGHKVRYNGNAAATGHALLAPWQREGRVVAVCPEIAGGLPTPRPAAEITAGSGGAKVLQGMAQVVVVDGSDMTQAFVAGALLLHNGLTVFSEHQLEEAQAFLQLLDDA